MPVAARSLPPMPALYSPFLVRAIADYVLRMRYQFVDCRWELGSPGRGRELYLAGHVPGASFLDVDEDLSDLSVQGQGRHPLPSSDRFAAAASRAGIGPGVTVV